MHNHAWMTNPLTDEEREECVRYLRTVAGPFRMAPEKDDHWMVRLLDLYILEHQQLLGNKSTATAPTATSNFNVICQGS